MLRNKYASLQLLSVSSTILLASSLSAAAVDPIPYAGCGFLEPGVECPRFVGDDGTTFSLPGADELVGEYIAVSGTICFDCPNICHEGPVLQPEIITWCLINPPKVVFSRCGTLIDDATGQVPCTLFQTDFDGQLYLLENIPPEFSVGDHVRVTSDEFVI